MLNSPEAAPSTVPINTPVTLTFTGNSTRVRFMELSLFAKNVGRVIATFDDYEDTDGNNKRVRNLSSTDYQAGCGD